MNTAEANTLVEAQAEEAAPRVLIVDDEMPLQQAIKLALKNEGYRLYIADNGQQGLELFREHKPELIFLDLRMPVMDGYQFLEAVHITPDALYTVIAITGHGVDREIERCYSLGVEFFLKKPLSLVEICCVARRCIESKRLKAERERLIVRLQEAKDTINYLKSFLVICSSCKRVRDTDEKWYELDAYIRSHTGTQFSHSVCPDCVEKLYPNLSDKILRMLK